MGYRLGLGFLLGISALSVDPVMTLCAALCPSLDGQPWRLIGPPAGLIADHIGYHRALAFVAPPNLAIILAGQVPD